MRAWSAIRILERTRTQLCLPGKLFFFRANFADTGVNESVSSKVVLRSPLAAEKEEAKAVLISFLKKQGLSNVAARTINKSDRFIDHLVSKLHAVHKSRHPVGGELAAIETSGVLIPYLRSLLEKHGNALVDLMENFPNLAAEPVAPVVPSNGALDFKKLRAASRVSESGPDGQLPPRTLYLIELGMNLEQIMTIANGFPAFAYYSLEGKIKPLVEFLLDLGTPKSDLLIILTKCPQLFGFSLSENLILTMRFFENLGVDKRQWPKVIRRYPHILTFSKQKVEATIAFFYELGLSTENIGKILTRHPAILGYSLESKLRPTSEYLLSLGIDVARLVKQSPEVFGLSLETNLKPITEFFLERGCSMEEIGSMIYRFGQLYTCSLAKNLTPKWEFLLTMGYSKEELIKFPQYFGYSFVRRIRPRYARLKECGVKFGLSQMLSRSDHDFDEALKKRMVKKMLSDKALTDKSNTEVLQPAIEQ